MKLPHTINQGRVLGFFLLFSAIAGTFGTALRGLSGHQGNLNFFPQHLLESANQMKFAIATDILAAIILIATGLFLVHQAKTFYKTLAVGYLVILSTHFVFVVLSNSLHIGLISLAQNGAISNGTTPSDLSPMVQMLFEGYFWFHFFILLLYSLGAFVLSYYFLKAKKVPRWLTIWGLCASPIVFLGALMQIIGFEVSLLLFAQNGIYMLVLIGWLLIKGFLVDDQD